MNRQNRGRARRPPASAAPSRPVKRGEYDRTRSSSLPKIGRRPQARALARNAYALLCFLRARAESDVAIVADAAVLEALVNSGSASGEPCALDPTRVHDFRLRFEENLEPETPEAW